MMHLRSLAAGAAVLSTLMVAFVPARAQLCNHVLSNDTDVKCTPFTVTGWPNDSTGGRYSLIARSVGGSGHAGAPVRVKGEALTRVGALLSHGGGVIPPIDFTTHAVAGEAHALALLALAPEDGEIASNARAVVVEQVGATRATRIVAAVSSGGPEPVQVEVVSNGHVVRSSHPTVAGEVARLPGWPTGFSVRAVSGGGIEYSWLLGGRREVRLSSAIGAKGDVVRVTVPSSAGAAIAPVLFSASGFDRMFLRSAGPAGAARVRGARK